MAEFIKLITSTGQIALNPDQVTALEERSKTETIVRTTASTEGGAAKRYIVLGSLDQVMETLSA